MLLEPRGPVVGVLPQPWTSAGTREGRPVGSLGPEENKAGLTPRTACVGMVARPTEAGGTGRQQGFIRARA